MKPLSKSVLVEYRELGHIQLDIAELRDVRKVRW